MELQFKGLRYFHIFSFFIVAIGAAMLAIFHYQKAVETQIKNVENKNILVAQSVRTLLWHHYSMLLSSGTHTTDRAQRPLNEHPNTRFSNISELQLGLPADVHELLRSLLTRSAVKKLKIYDLDGMTLYSTTPEEIGQSHAWSRGLQHAKTGQPYAVLVTNEESHEVLPTASEYVETYFPIYAFPENKIIGVFELYSDVGAELAAIRMSEKKFAGALALAVLLVFVLLVVTNRAMNKRDMTRAQQLVKLATRDPLTGLPNGAVVRDRLQEAIVQAKHLGQAVAILLIDIDRFKLINDNLGHDTGDQMIKVLANRLSALKDQKDTIGRFAGEFIMIIPEHDTTGAPLTTINRIMEEIKKPVSVADQKLIVSCSIGVSLYPRDAVDVESLLKRADIAMHQAKGLGGNGYEFYSREMDAGLANTMQMSSALQEALEQEEFLLHYQPQFNLRTGELVAAEALLRWQRSDQSMVSPNEFIPLAEDIGLIGPIGEWVLNTACTQAKTWQMKGLPKIRVAINLSARQLDLQDLAVMTEQALTDSGLEPRYLDLELTESLIMRNPDKAIVVFNRIKDLDIGLSIDDFGTGYSCMNYLKHFPLNRVKIDQSFVRNILTDAEDKVIALTIISMAHHLGLNVLAEGVESKEQIRFLHKHGCDEVQGFYCGRPMPAAEFAQLLRENRRLEEYETEKHAGNASRTQEKVRFITQS